MNYINVWIQAQKGLYYYFNFLSGCEERKMDVTPIGQEERRFAPCSYPAGEGPSRRPTRAWRRRLAESEDQAKFAYAADGRRVQDHQPLAEAGDRSDVLLRLVRFGHLRIVVTAAYSYSQTRPAIYLSACYSARIPTRHMEDLLPRFISQDKHQSNDHDGRHSRVASAVTAASIRGGLELLDAIINTRR